MIDWLITPVWLTHTVAFAIIGIGSVLFIVASILRTKARGKNKENIQRKMMI